MDLRTPPAEIDVDEALIARLLASQAPELAQRTVRIVANGWDNVIARLGDEHLVRLPRRALAAPLIVHEQRWLSEVAARLPLPIPVPIVAGHPQHGYPWHWSVCPWLAGANAQHSPPRDEFAAARALGEFVRALHVPAPHDAPANPFRGQPLARRVELMEQRLATLRHLVPAGTADRWEMLHRAPPWSAAAVWVHGDLHPANLLVEDGELSAVIDFGDLTAGDPATDLAVAWMLFGPAARAEFLTCAGCDEATVLRAAAWAISLSCAYLTSSADNPTMAAIGRTALDNVAEQFG